MYQHIPESVVVERGRPNPSPQPLTAPVCDPARTRRPPVRAGPAPSARSRAEHSGGRPAGQSGPEARTGTLAPLPPPHTYALRARGFRLGFSGWVTLTAHVRAPALSLSHTHTCARTHTHTRTHARTGHRGGLARQNSNMCRSVAIGTSDPITITGCRQTARES